MSKKALVLPAVQPQHVTTVLPEGVLFCSPGLRETTGDLFYVSPKLPMSAAEARGQLHELRSYATTFDRASDLTGAVLAEQAVDAPSGFWAGEFADIDAFAETGEFSGKQPVEVRTAEGTEVSVLIAAQKTLLMAWDMEERVSELAALQEKFDTSSTKMSEILGITDEDELEDLTGIETKAELKGDIEEDLNVPWQAVASAIVELASEDTCFVAVKKELIELVKKCGKDITPESVRGEEYGFDSASASDWRLYSVQAYRAFGYVAIPEGKPQLARTIEIFTVA